MPPARLRRFRSTQGSPPARARPTGPALGQDPAYCPFARRRCSVGCSAAARRAGRCRGLGAVHWWRSGTRQTGPVRAQASPSLGPGSSPSLRSRSRPRTAPFLQLGRVEQPCAGDRPASGGWCAPKATPAQPCTPALVDCPHDHVAGGTRNPRGKCHRRSWWRPSDSPEQRLNDGVIKAVDDLASKGYFD